MPTSSILTKAMGIIDLITAAPAPLTLAEVSDRSGLPKSSAHRLLVLLREAGALSYDAELQTYVPGPRLMRWGVQTMQSNNLAALAAPHMKALCRETGMRVALSIMDDDAVLFLHTIETGAPFRLAPKVGQHSPLHASAAGKLFLASRAKDDLSAFLVSYEFEQCTEFTITDAEVLSAEIGKVQKQGFAVSAREEFRQTSGFAMPIKDVNGKTIAALSIWNVGGIDLVDSLVSHLETVSDAVTAIQTGFGQAD